MYKRIWLCELTINQNNSIVTQMNFDRNLEFIPLSLAQNSQVNTTSSFFLSFFVHNSVDEPEILWSDGLALGMDHTQVGQLHLMDNVGFTCFLDGQNCCCLPPNVHQKFLGQFMDQSLEGQFSE